MAELAEQLADVLERAQVVGEAVELDERGLEQGDFLDLRQPGARLLARLEREHESSRKPLCCRDMGEYSDLGATVAIHCGHSAQDAPGSLCELSAGRTIRSPTLAPPEGGWVRAGEERLVRLAANSVLRIVHTADGESAPENRTMRGDKRKQEAIVDTQVDVGSRPGHAASKPNEALLPGRRLLAVGSVSGLLGGIAMALPVVIWGWIDSAHRALELPMAATSWLFGLVHFSHDQNLWWPIVLGTALLGVYWAVSGIAFAALADWSHRLDNPAPTIAAGAAWSVVNFMLLWYMLLPVARDGVPFRASPANPLLFTAPNWAWILGFTVSGLVIAACYAVMRPSPASRSKERRVERNHEPRTRLRQAA